MVNIKFYDKYDFLPWDKKRGIKILTRKIKELEQFIKCHNERKKRYIKGIDSDIFWTKKTIEEFDKLRKELKNGR